MTIKSSLKLLLIKVKYHGIIDDAAYSWGRNYF